MFCFPFSWADFIFLHGNFLLIGFNFSIKILLAKRTLFFWILTCCLLSISSFCIGSISWCCLAIPLFCCSSHVPLFHGIPIVPPVFRCSTIVPVFRQRSSVPVFRRSSVFQCSWFYSMPALIRNRREANSFYLAREVEKCGHVLAEKKVTF